MAPEREAAPTRLVEPQLWRACAGAGGRIPAIGSRVFYFPQGHAVQASFPPDFSTIPSLRTAVLCRITDVRLLANPDTDEVCASISLDPRLHPPVAPPPEKLASNYFASPLEIADGGGAGGRGGGFLCFSKILTASDANNGGGFSVPRFCADSIFPPLDFDADPPVQTISVRDVHGQSWSFRHIYRGTPRRHLLTTGWSKFVSSKRLVTGDSVVFMKNLSGQMSVGVRRRSCGPVYHPSPFDPTTALARESLRSGEGFSKNVRGKVSAASVVKAVRSAGVGLPFDVLYYPRAGSPEFVVAEEIVEAAMKVHWTTGMRVKMSVETEDSARTTWFEGTVSSVAIDVLGPRPRSPWRMLEIIWDEPEVLQNVRHVSPWQVELVSASPRIGNSLAKRFRLLESSEFHNDTGNSILSEMTGLKSCLPPSKYSDSVFPAGMQGARHDSFFVPSLCDGEMITNQKILNGLRGANASQENNVSIDLKTGGSQSQLLSPPSQGSIQVLNKEVVEPVILDPSKKATKGSFQLFGQVIHIEQLTNSDADILVTQCPRISAVGACQ